MLIYRKKRYVNIKTVKKKLNSKKKSKMNPDHTENNLLEEKKKRKSNIAGLQAVIGSSTKTNLIEREIQYKKTKITHEEEDSEETQNEILIDLSKVGVKDAFQVLKQGEQNRCNKELVKSQQKKLFQAKNEALKEENANATLPTPRTTTRRIFTEKEKEEIIDMYTKYGKTFTILSGVKEGTLNSIITAFNSKGEESFLDHRKSNGRPFYSTIDEHLKTYILERRKNYLPVSLNMVLLKAKELSKDVNFSASNIWLHNFLKRYNFSLRKRTKKVKKIKEDYLKDVHVYFEKLDKLREDDCLFINFDESNMCFDMSSDFTVDMKGAKLINIMTHNKERETCSIASGITSEGNFILPLIIFKYQYSGQQKGKRTCPKKYESWTMTTYPAMTRFTPSGFNKKEIMAEWIIALKRKLTIQKEKRKVILLLDSASCHQGSEITQALEGSNIQIIIIPGGCTGFLQPMDTTIFRPLKKLMKSKYEDWLTGEQEKIQRALSREIPIQKENVLGGPQFSDIRSWFCTSLGQISKNVIISSFATCGITFGLNDSVKLNYLLLENWKKVIVYLELTASQNNPYLDNEEQRLRVALDQDNIIVCKDELSDSVESEDESGLPFRNRDDLITSFEELDISKEEIVEKEEQQTEEEGGTVKKKKVIGNEKIKKEEKKKEGKNGSNTVLKSLSNSSTFIKNFFGSFNRLKACSGRSLNFGPQTYQCIHYSQGKFCFVISISETK